MSNPTTSGDTIAAKPPRSLGRLAIRGFGGLLLLLVLIQLVPYGRDHTNPPVQAEPAWDSPQTRTLFFRACGDCHSNQTTWPWYSNVAPISWLVTHDTLDGRRSFNVSEWGRARNKGDEAARETRRGDMPPWFYTPLHPDAHLSQAETQTLIAGLTATFGDQRGGESGSQSEPAAVTSAHYSAEQKH